MEWGCAGGSSSLLRANEYALVKDGKLCPRKRSSAGSCVTITIVLPNWPIEFCQQVSGFLPQIFASKSPVGSSATRMVGSVAMARANSHALLLPTRKLAWVMAHAVSQTTAFQRSLYMRFSFRFCFKFVNNSGSSTFSKAVSTGISYRTETRGRCGAPAIRDLAFVHAEISSPRPPSARSRRDQFRRPNSAGSSCRNQMVP